MMYYTLTLTTIFSVISPIFKYCFLQRYYINTLYTQMHYSGPNVMKLNIICFCTKCHTTVLFLAFLIIWRLKWGKGVCRENGTSAALCDAFFLVNFNFNFFFLSVQFFKLRYLGNRSADLHE